MAKFTHHTAVVRAGSTTFEVSGFEAHCVGDFPSDISVTVNGHLLPDDMCPRISIEAISGGHLTTSMWTSRSRASPNSAGCSVCRSRRPSGRPPWPTPSPCSGESPRRVADRFVVVQNRVVPGEGPLIPGSRTGPCELCHADVWIPPSSEDALGCDGSVLACLSCGLRVAVLVKAEGGGFDVARSPDADGELRAAGHPEVAESDTEMTGLWRRIGRL